MYESQCLDWSCHEKTCLCIFEKKAADQLCCNRPADQLLRFRYIDNTISQLSKSDKPVPIFCVGKPALRLPWLQNLKTAAQNVNNLVYKQIKVKSADKIVCTPDFYMLMNNKRKLIKDIKRDTKA